MKKISMLTILTFFMAGCYDDYVRDYDFTGVYIAYQYDLRSFVVGEGMQFDLGVVLGGTISNLRNRDVIYAIDDALLAADLAVYGTVNNDGELPEPFTAIEAMRDGSPTVGHISHVYVKNSIVAAGINSLTPLPDSYYELSSDRINIAQGRHTGTMTVKADSAALLADPQSYKPYYALGFKIVRADADSILKTKCFSVIAVRIENMLFGDYWHGGKTTIRNNITGSIVHESVYQTAIPQEESRVYTLTTSGPKTLTTNRVGNTTGSLRLTQDDDGSIGVSMADGSKTIEPVLGGSTFNRAKLLQNRKIFLNYKFDNGDGTTSYVMDTLTFRNRIRDGVNEWQDGNPANYN